MSDYIKKGSGSPIKKIGDTEYYLDAAKQVPGPLPDNYYDRASTPSSCSFAKTPHYVIIGSLAGSVGFYFGSSASFSSKATTEGQVAPGTNNLSGSQHYSNFGALASGTTLHINPTAWSGSVGDVVTFIYKGGLDGMGRP